MKLLREAIKTHFVFLALLAVFILTPLAYFTYVPLWDAYQFTKVCYVPAAQFLSLRCVDHSAPFNNLLFGVVQKIDIGNPVLIYTENIFLGVIGLIFFYALLKDIFGDRLTNAERTLLTFLFGFHPVFLAQIIQPGLDYVLPIYGVMLLFFLLRTNYIGAALVGMMLAFTKEPGLMFYGVCIFWYFYVFSGLGRQKELFTKRLKTVWVLIVPVISFACYAHFYPLQAQRGDSVAELLLQMFRFNETPYYFIGQFESIAVINFYWIVPLIILGGMVLYVIKSLIKPPDIENLRPVELNIIYIFLCAVSVLWFLTRVEFFNNPRYMLPWLPLLVLAFASVYVFLSGKITRIVLLGILLCLVYLSAFRTIDPVSKAVFGTFNFGRHQMLKINVAGRFVARDTLVYNFEFTEFHYLVEKAIRTLGYQLNYVMTTDSTWYTYEDFATFDRETGRRTLLGLVGSPRAEHINIMDETRALNDEKIRDIYFILMPAHKGEETRKALEKGFKAVDTITIEERGYALDVIHFVKI